MTTIDSNGIIRYEDSDGAPTPPVLNLGMQSVSDALTPFRNKVKWQGAGVSRSANLYTDDTNETGARLRLAVNGTVSLGRPEDSVLRGLPFAMQTREYSASFTSRSSYTVSFNFTTNLFTAPPVVTTNIASGSGSALGWISRATQITATGFTFYLANVNGTNSAWSGIPVQWTAIQMTP